MSDKVYKTYAEQIEILRSRNLDISTDEQVIKVMNILERENYYSVINGYKALFIEPNSDIETYRPNTCFEELYTVFCFDRNIRSIYLKYILKVEHQIKSVIAHEFSSLYGYNKYLELNNFDISNADKEKQVSETIKRINDAISNQNGKSKEITHYLSSYGYVPLWVLVNILTFGGISYFYANMKPHDKNEVARKFNVRPEELTKYIKNLTLARNLCAHDERFFDFNYKSSLSTSYIHNFKILDIPYSNGNYEYGTKDAFSIAVILTRLLSKDDIKEFILYVDSEFMNMEKNLKTVSLEKIKLKMGFGTNWKKLLEL